MSATSRALSLSNSSAKKLARKSPSRVAQAKRRQQRSMLFESLEDRNLMAGDLYGSAVLADGPLAFWQFNEGTGTAPADTVSVGNVGAFTNTPAPNWVSGSSGTPGDFSLNFNTNGGNTAGGYVSVASAAGAVGAFDSIVTNDAITVEFWHFGDPLTNLRQNTTFFLGDGSAQPRTANIHLPWSDGRVYWDAGNACCGGGTRLSVVLPSSDFYEAQWNHYAFVKNGSTNFSGIYRNGTLIFSTTGSTNAFPNPDRLFIGQNFDGMLDDVAVYDKALTLPQIQAHVAASNLVAVDDVATVGEDGPATTISVIGSGTNIPISGGTLETGTSVAGGSVAGTLADGFAYNPVFPTSTLPDQAYGSDGDGFHNGSNTDAIIRYDFATPITLAANQQIAVDLYGRADCCQDRDDNVDIQFLTTGNVVVGTVAGRSIPNSAPTFLRVSSFDAPSITAGTLITGFRVVGHDSEPVANNSFTLMEVRAASLTGRVDVGTNLSVASINTAGTQGTVNIVNAAQGTISYDPNGQFNYLAADETATDTFTYSLSNGTLTDTATVTVTITGQNDPPVAVDDAGYFTTEDAVFNVPADVYPNLVQANSPAVYYRLNETSGTVVANSGTAGSALDAAANNGVALNVAGAIPGDPNNSGADFDGSDDFILSNGNISSSQLGLNQAYSSSL